MLETIREYAQERLDASGEAEALRRQHACYFIQQAEAAEQQLTWSVQAGWLRWFAVEYDNLRAALTWVAERDEEELELRLVGAQALFWLVSGELSEGRRWLEAALRRHQPATSAVPPAVWAKVLLGAGKLALAQGDSVGATRLHEECVARFREWGDTQGLAWSLSELGALVQAQGNDRRAMALYEESATLFRQLGDQAGLAAALNDQGGLARQQGDDQRATALHEESFALFRALNDRGGMATALRELGATLLAQGDPAGALARHDESLALSRELDDSWGIAASLTALALVALAQGDPTRAGNLLEESLELFRGLDDKEGVAWALHDLGTVAWLLGRHGHAGKQYADSLAIFQDVGDKVGVVCTLEGLGVVAVAQQHLTQAARLLGAALALRDALGVPRQPAERLRDEAAVATARAQLGEVAFAAAWAEGRALPLEQVIAVARDVGAPSAPSLLPAPAVASARPVSTGSLRDSGAGLTAREVEVLRLVAEGLSNREIAQRANLSELTVKGYVEQILQQLGARNRVHAAILATKRGWI
jgi:DNA-binding CsgD family transcriptional regulator/tetratricopeptide (TPR) repeat protein